MKLLFIIGNLELGGRETMRGDIVGGHIGSKDGWQGAVWPCREALLLGWLGLRTGTTEGMLKPKRARVERISGA